MNTIVPVELQAEVGSRDHSEGYVVIAARLRVHVLGGGQSRSNRRGRTSLGVDIRNPARRFREAFEFNRLTPLGEEDRRPPIKIRDIPAPVRFQTTRAFLKILRYSFRRSALRVLRQSSEESEATDARELLQSLGGVWIKVGQLLSLRNDLLSDPMCRELASLQHESLGFPPDVARQVIEADLEAPLSRLFAHFEPLPFAAASVSQVHRATLLRDNRAVVVKVMRPDVIESFARDLRLLSTFIRLMRALGIGDRFRLGEGLMEIRALMNEEVDYSFEAVNLKRMRRTLREHGIAVPKVYYKYCRARVLVMEEIPGILMSQYIRVRSQDPAMVRRWEIENNIDPNVVGRKLMVSVLRQILEDNLFHGDLHPGNIMLLPDNKIGLIDFGSVGQLNTREWFLYRHSLGSMAKGDYDRAGDAMLMTAGAVSVIDSASLRRDMSATLRSWEVRARFPQLSYAERSIAAMSAEIAKVMAQYKVPLAWGLMRVGRTLSTVDGSLQVLVPDADFRKFYMAYFNNTQKRNRSIAGQRKSLATLGGQLSGLVGDVRMLLGEGIRTQALRTRGMPDRLMRFRMTVLRFGRMILWGLVLIEVFAFFSYRHYKNFSPVEHVDHLSVFDIPIIHEISLMIVEGVPVTKDLHWIFTLLVLMICLRLSSMAHRALRRPE